MANQHGPPHLNYTQTQNYASTASSTATVSNSTTTLKQRQVAHLANRLFELSRRVEEMTRLLDKTAEQSESIRVLGVYQAAWFMSSARILTKIDLNEEGGLEDST